MIHKPRIFKRGRYYWCKGNGLMCHGLSPEGAWRTWALHILFS